MKSAVVKGAIVAVLGLSSQAYADTVQLGITEGTGPVNGIFSEANFASRVLGDNSTEQRWCLEQDQSGKCEADSWHSATEVEMPAQTGFADAGAIESMASDKSVFPAPGGPDPMLGTGLFTINQQLSNVNVSGPLSSSGSFFATSSFSSSSLSSSSTSSSFSSTSASTPLPSTWPMMLSVLAATALLGWRWARRPRRNGI